MKIDGAELTVIVTALLLIALTLWYFFGSRK